MKKVLLGVVACVLMLSVLLAGCTSPTVNPTQEPTSSEEISATPTATVTIVPTVTPQPTQFEGVPGEKRSDGTYAYYVSANKGSDLSAGTKNNPFKTISKAAELAGPGDTIYVHGGTYYESVKLNSGEKGKPVTITAVQWEIPVLTPTVPYDGQWSLYKDNIYVADLSDIHSQINTEFVQVFLDEDSLVEARYPNMGPSLTGIMEYKRAVAQQGTNSNTIVTKEELKDIKGATVVIWPGSNGASAWVGLASKVASVDGKKIRLRDNFASQEQYTGQNAYIPVKGNPFFITGALSLLDAPGEYYYDKTEQKLYLYMPDGSDPTGRAITVRGKSSEAIVANNSQYVNIKGIKMYGGGINMNGADNCRIEECSVRYADHYYASGFTFYTLPNSMIVVGDNNYITKCEFAYTAGNGITLGGNGNVFTDNIVHDCDYSGTNYSGVQLMQSSDTEISYNSIYNSGRYLIYFTTETTYGKCIIKNNYLSSPACLTSDCGVVYTWNSNGGGTEIYNNFVDCKPKNDNGTNDKYVDGLYLDNYCSNFKVHHNIVIGGAPDGLRTNLSNKNTIFANNTVIGANIGYGVYSYPTDDAIGENLGFYNNLFVDLKSYEVSYYGTENGVDKYYNGSLVDGKVPFPFNPEQRISSSNNASGKVDELYRPVDGSNAIDGGIVIEGITDGYLGDAPDIGALEYGQEMFKYGASWK